MKQEAELTTSLNPRDFCVTDDDLFLVPDQQARNIKVCERNGKFLEWIKAIGRKGYGMNELVKPAFCFYNKEGGRFGFMDFGLRKVFIYDRIGRVEFIRKKAIYCFNLGFDIQISGDRLLISGYKADKNKRDYHFYSVDLKNNEVINLLPSYYKYGFSSHKKFDREYLKKINTREIGINVWFDIQGNDVYFVWEGALKIIKIDIKYQLMTSFVSIFPLFLFPFISTFDGISSHRSFYPKGRRKK